MKNFLQTLTIAILMFSFASAANAAETAKKVYAGYVVLEGGEKLTGKITMLSPTLNEVKVKFTNEAGKTKTYKAKEVAEYGFTYNRYDRTTENMVATNVVYVNKKVGYSAVPFGSKNVLIERQETGKINFFNFFYETRMQNNPLQKTIYVEKGEKFEEVTRKNYKRILKDMTTDYPELRVKIGTPGYGFKHAAKIVKEYNDYMTADNDPIFGMN